MKTKNKFLLTNEKVSFYIYLFFTNLFPKIYYIRKTEQSQKT